MSKRKLKSLAQANGEALQREANGKPCPNGIACPKCGCELWDTSPNVILTSHPGQKYVACVSFECGYTGTRFV